MGFRWAIVFQTWWFNYFQVLRMHSIDDPPRFWASELEVKLLLIRFEKLRIGYRCISLPVLLLPSDQLVLTSLAWFRVKREASSQNRGRYDLSAADSVFTDFISATSSIAYCNTRDCYWWNWPPKFPRKSNAKVCWRDSASFDYLEQRNNFWERRHSIYYVCLELKRTYNLVFMANTLYCTSQGLSFKA